MGLQLAEESIFKLIIGVNMLKNTWLLLLTSVPSLAYTEDCCVALLPPESIESCQLPVGIFYPAQYSLGDCGLDISVSGEFIYWELNRDSLTTVGNLVSVENNGLEQDTKILIHHQGYRPGFKVAAGIGLPGCDNWKVDIEYTWFHHTSTNHFNTTQTSVITLPLLLELFDPALFGYLARSAKSELTFNLEFMQGLVGRTFYLSERLIVNAAFGLKAWWSSLHSKTTYTPLVGDILSTQTTKSGLWGIGPYVSAQIKGLLWCGTYLYGKAGIWTNYTRFTHLKVQNNFAAFIPLNNVETNPTYYYQTPLFYDAGVGLGWGTYLCNCDYHIDLLLGYDMMTNFERTFSLTSGDPHREFHYHGLFVKAQFDF